MKKLILILALGLPALVPAFSQNYSIHGGPMAELYYFGIKGGLTLSTIRAERAQDRAASPLAGYTLGCHIGTSPFSVIPISFETGLSLTQKGGRQNIDGKVDRKMVFLDLPLLVKYNWALDDMVSIHPYAGAFLALALDGYDKNYALQKKLNLWKNYKHFDSGLKVGVCASYAFAFLDAGFEFGLFDINNRTEYAHARSSCFYLALGINF